MDKVMYDKIYRVWVIERKPQYVIVGGIMYEVIEDGDEVKFIPVKEDLYGSVSLSNV